VAPERENEKTERGNLTMPQYLIRFDRGPSERFDAASDDAARDYVREVLIDEGAEDGDGGGLYRVDDGSRGDEEYLGDIRLGDDEPGDDECFVACDWRDGAP
jgi:hypothetical protein